MALAQNPKLQATNDSHGWHSASLEQGSSCRIEQRWLGSCPAQKLASCPVTLSTACSRETRQLSARQGAPTVQVRRSTDYRAIGALTRPTHLYPGVNSFALLHLVPGLLTSGEARSPKSDRELQEERKKRQSTVKVLAV